MEEFALGIEDTDPWNSELDGDDLVVLPCSGRAELAELSRTPS